MSALNHIIDHCIGSLSNQGNKNVVINSILMPQKSPRITQFFISITNFSITDYECQIYELLFFYYKFINYD